MGELFPVLQAFYEKVEWPMVQVPGEAILTTTYEGTHGQWVFVVVPHEDLRVVTMFSRSPMECPPERFGEVSVFLERVNFGMTYGAWVMDREDGEIRFRIGLDVSEGEPSEHLLMRSTLLCITAMDSLLPALRAVIEEGVSAEDALKRLVQDGA